MDNRPIGFFDSGLGGLTCIPYLSEELPEEKFIYFGDTARTPYGSKAVSTIQKFSLQIAEFLAENDVKLMVIACNTISATALSNIQEKFPDIPVLGIIKPAAEKIAKIYSANNKVGVIGTKATIKSEAYKKHINEQKDTINVFSTACPVFVALIEEGIQNDQIIDGVIKHYMDEFILKNKIDVLVLGCTHYPFIRANIERLYPHISIIDPSQVLISEVKKTLIEKNMLAKNSTHENIFYASDVSEIFTQMVERILGNMFGSIADGAGAYVKSKIFDE